MSSVFAGRFASQDTDEPNTKANYSFFCRGGVSETKPKIRKMPESGPVRCAAAVGRLSVCRLLGQAAERRQGFGGRSHAVAACRTTFSAGDGDRRVVPGDFGFSCSSFGRGDSGAACRCRIHEGGRTGPGRRSRSFRSPVFRCIGCDGRGSGPVSSAVLVVRQAPAGKRPDRPRRRVRANIGSRCRTIRCGGRQESAAVSGGGGLSALILPSLPEDARARRSGNKEGTASAVPSPYRMRRVSTASRRNGLSIRSSF